MLKPVIYACAENSKKTAKIEAVHPDSVEIKPKPAALKQADQAEDEEEEKEFEKACLESIKSK